MNDILIRALKTFLQGALSVLALNVMNVTSLDAAQALAVAALAGGISALQNFIRDTM
jgi:hypothetical protein